MHLKALVFLISLLSALCCGCCTVPARFREIPLPENVQTAEQLHLEYETQQPFTGTWIPYFTVEALFADPDEAVCRQAVRQLLEQLQSMGIRTLFVHVCAFGEAAYPSAYYPPNPAVNGHDVMQIFTDECASLGIALHAWLNPLRLQTEDRMQQQSGDALLCEQFRDADSRSRRFLLWDGRYYLSPAEESTGVFLSDVITELISRYHPAGIHIDDYFYPTDAPEFDSEAFRLSGASDRAAWRREQITALVRNMYSAVHAADASAVFSVSPQGDLQKNRDSLYADAAAWLADGACADLIIPQIYFGYQNESLPFPDIRSAWESLPRAENVQLIAGLAAYKSGSTDEHAGSGAEEWLRCPDTLVRQTGDILSSEAFSGVVFYHADALTALPEAVRQGLHEAFRAEQKDEK